MNNAVYKYWFYQTLELNEEMVTCDYLKPINTLTCSKVVIYNKPGTESKDYQLELTINSESEEKRKIVIDAMDFPFALEDVQILSLGLKKEGLEEEAEISVTTFF
tara:strand:- start:320 stop:634 length:315 start_codon:yes stop_codon:yes gene_type:complete